MSFQDNYGTPEDRPQSQQAPRQDYANQWRTWLTDPDNRTAMMQFGINLMQPMAIGQTPLGHVGQAFGAAGEAVGRAEDRRRKDDLAESQLQLREAQAGAAESRAGAMAGNLQLQQDKLTLMHQLGLQGKYTALLEEWRKQMKDRNDANVIRPKNQQVPEVPFDQWLQQNPQLVRLFMGGAPAPNLGTATGTTPASPAPGGTTAAPQQYVPGRTYTFNGQRYIFTGGGDPKIAPGRPGSAWEKAQSAPAP